MGVHAGVYVDIHCGLIMVTNLYYPWDIDRAVKPSYIRTYTEIMCKDITTQATKQRKQSTKESIPSGSSASTSTEQFFLNIDIAHISYLCHILW